MKKLHFLLILLSFSSFVFGQTGTVAGIMTDKESGEPIIYANVFITETGNGFNTDFDGAFSVALPAGSYTFEVSYVGYTNENFENITVVAGETTTLNINLVEEGEVINEVVVVAKQIRNTENALMAIQRKSTNVIDGISSQSFRKIGDSNAAAAIKRVTGVSVEGGKYVYVRGLGDRYTKTLLNGMDIPGLDPDRNSLQMDIFPTNVLDNIIVSKTFTPNLPGDFTGGVVNIFTKDFPDEKTANISLGSSYNPNMHFNQNFITAQKSGTDWLGFDNGLRELPINKFQSIPSPINDPLLTTLTSRFANNMGTMREQNLANFNAGFSFGNQIEKENVTIGFNGAINYKSSTEYYEGVQFNNYIKDSNSSNMELLADRTSTGDLGSSNTLISGMLGGALKYKNHEFSMKALHIQNGESKAGFFERNSFIRASNTILRDNAEYTETGVSNLLLSGSHRLKNDFNINWKVSPTYSSIQDKDIRVSPYRLNDDGTLTIEPSEGAQPRRLFRDLNETNLSAKVDFEKSLTIADKKLKLMSGLSNTYKERDYSILSYLVNVKGQSLMDLSGDASELFDPANLWTPQTGIGVFIAGNFEPTNTYNANQNITAAYVMGEIAIATNLELTTGVRVEKFTHRYTGQNNTGSIVYNNEEILNNLDFLPAVNLIYKLSNKVNLRGSFAKTLARPSFKEASIAQIYDAVSDRTFIGNIDLLQTNIDNYDLRWESFFGNGEMISVSGFYKAFNNPIELVAFSSSAPEDLQPRNVGNATVQGIEVELRKNFGFISPALKAFNFVSNVTLVKSAVALDKSEGGEFDSRKISSRVGETITETRQMQGQAPYIINSFISYQGEENGWEANLSYNVQGRSLAIVGIGLNPDVYTSPFHNLSFKASKQIGVDQKLRISAGVKNILGSERNKVYSSYEGNDQIFESFLPQRTYSLSLSYNLY